MNISNDSTLITPISTPEIGGLAFFLANLPDYLPYNLISALGAISGILGWFNCFKVSNHIYSYKDKDLKIILNYGLNNESVYKTDA